MPHEHMIDDLLRPEAYPWLPAKVEVIETHVSWVFLAGERVVKVKRPVRYPFVDHSTLERRHRSCLDEVRLNRRLTDGVYLDVVPIVHSDIRYQVGGAGTPVEWATLMRRLPASGMLDHLLARDAAPPNLAELLAARLIPFHQQGAPRCVGEAGAVAASATTIVTDNLAELEPFSGEPLGSGQLELVRTSMLHFLGEHAALLQGRAAAGWVREGHGDLRAEHVCLEPGGVVQIFDCVEFNRDVRCADIASDLAYLLMDLTRLDAPEAAAGLLAFYRQEDCDLPDGLLRLYGAHRALVRTKIACIERGEANPDVAMARAEEAADYLDMASASALTIRPALIAMTGLSGTGKSTVARRLARTIGARHFSSDVVRKELAGVSGGAAAGWGEGIYRPELTEATYARLFALARTRLNEGIPVVLDAAFLDAEQRMAAAAAAQATGVPFALVETICDEATVAARLAARAARGDSPSDATWETYQQQRAALAAAPPGIPPGAIAVTIDTGVPPSLVLEPAIAALAKADMIRPEIPG
jgi:aminoglycoside phosphotransferase family enzyme/predicted kinase